MGCGVAFAAALAAFSLSCFSLAFLCASATASAWWVGWEFLASMYSFSISVIFASVRTSCMGGPKLGFADA